MAFRPLDIEVIHKIAKYFLVFVHTVFVIAGTGVIVASTFAYIDWKEDAAAFLTNENLPNFSIAGLVIGCILVVLSGFGVLAGFTENRCMLIMNSLFLILSVLLFLCLGAAVFIIRNELGHDIHKQSGQLWNDLKSSWLHAAAKDPKAVCDLMVTLQCSGFADGVPYGGIANAVKQHNLSETEEQFADPKKSLLPGWEMYCINRDNSNNPVANPYKPTYCTAYEDCRSLYDQSFSSLLAFTDGCINKVYDDVQSDYELVGWSIFGCAFLLIFTILMDCCLFYYHPAESGFETQSLIYGESESEMSSYPGTPPQGRFSRAGMPRNHYDSQPGTPPVRHPTYGTSNKDGNGKEDSVCSGDRKSVV